MYIGDFIEFLKEFPEDYKINLFSLRDSLGWVKQDHLDLESDIKEKSVNFYMYKDDLLKKEKDKSNNLPNKHKWLKINER